MLKKQLLTHFSFTDEKTVLKKIDKFIKDGLSSLHIVFDFDRTLTTTKQETGINVTTYGVLSNHLPKAAMPRLYKLFNYYRPLEKENKLTEKEAVFWWEQTLELFVKHKVNFKKVEKDFFSKISTRSHAQEVFNFCEKARIPTIILSGGIKEIIDLWAKMVKVKPSLIISTSLKLSVKKEIIGWEKDSLIHILNKRKKGKEKIAKIQDKRPNTILIGDVLEDADMVEGEERVLRIFINDQKIQDKKILEKFDLLIKGQSFQPVLKLLTTFQSLQPFRLGRGLQGFKMG